MNLVNKYLKNNFLEGYGILSKVIISSDNPRREWSDLKLEIGKEYTVSEIKKCAGKFSCAKSCKTNCNAVLISFWSEKHNREITMSTCGYELLLESGEPLIVK